MRWLWKDNKWSLDNPDSVPRFNLFRRIKKMFTDLINKVIAALQSCHAKVQQLADENKALKAKVADLESQVADAGIAAGAAAALPDAVAAIEKTAADALGITVSGN